MSDMKLIGNEKIRSAFGQLINNLKQNNGGTIAINGETGMGKSYILNYLYEQVKDNDEVKAIIIDNQSPINDINIGNIQPLLPFSKAVRQLMDKSGSAQKRLAVNIGITTLASIPLIGDIFYAVKEYGRDWRQYKREKSSETVKKMNKTVADFYDTLIAYASNTPLVLFFDNMHFADNLSIELLENLIRIRNDFPIAIVFTYQEINTDNGIVKLKSKYADEDNNVSFFDLATINNEQTRDFCKIYFKNYKPNSQFEDWLYENSKGVPGLMMGYISHFSKNSPFDEKGNLKDDLDNSDVFPKNVTNAVANSIKELSEEEINILAICATEGVEFTAYLISHLLNTDVVSTIKKLRSIQNKVSVIKSIGAKIRYGVKTTSYRFGQAYCHKYFESILEYEEKISVHGQIAAFLKNKLEETSNKDLRNELAPFVAAHSIVSGDEETAKEMLLLAAQGAKEIDGKEIIEKAYQVYQDISSGQKQNTENADSVIFQELLNRTVMSMPSIEAGEGKEGSTAGTNYPIDFSYLRRTVVDEFHKGKYNKAIELIETYLESHKENLKPSEESQLLSLVARCYVELEQLDEAKEKSQGAINVLENYKEPLPECFALNVDAIIDFQQGAHERAFYTLKKAAKKSINLPPEIKLITISNIALLLKSVDKQKAEKYLYAVRKLTKQLNYEEFALDVFN